MSVIELDDVTKEYDGGGEIVRALDCVSMAVDPGEFVAIMGPSGSGKSTLLNLVGLLDVPTDGVVSLDGDDVSEFSDRELTTARRRSIGFVFQDFHLVPTLTAKENVTVPALYERTGDVDARAADLLERVGLGDRTDHNPNELSGGQKQRVAIARSLINQPRVLLADEPTGNLDRATGDTILDEFERIARTDEVAVVAVTHDEYVAERADRVIELIDGVIQSWS